MKPRLFFAPVIGICFILMSATSIPVTDSLNKAQSTIVNSNRTVITSPKPGIKKMGFFQRIAYKLMTKKMKKQAHHMQASAKRNNGNVALALGSFSLILTLLPLVAGGVLAGWAIAIPLAILAIIFGSKPKTGEYNTKAKIGKWFGVSSLAVLVLIILVAAIAFSGWY